MTTIIRLIVLACALTFNVTTTIALPDELLTAQTGKPNFNVFTPDDLVPIQFTVAGIEPGQADQTLNVKIVDEHSKPIVDKTIQVPGTAASWTTTLLEPASRLGFYRVYATLSNGVTLPKQGSRQAGYLTYCVVPDPAGRTIYPASEARFGMQGGFNGALNPAPYLGINWVNGPGRWDYSEPDHAGQFAQRRAADTLAGNTGPSTTPGATRGFEWCYVERDGKRQAWPIYPVFFLYNPPSWAYIPGKKVGSTAPLLPGQESAWADYCTAFAKSVVEDYPNLDVHFYQITWEPNWFNGTSQQFVDIYRLAYKAIHDVDTKAVVAGPTKSGVGDFNMGDEAEYFKAGLGSYLDAYTIHPYTKMPAEQQGFVDRLANLIAFPSKRAGRSIPVYSTEQGEQTLEDASKELDQARHLIRSSLITLGEGAKYYVAFYLHDYKGEPGYGYFYNLRDDEKFGTDELAPKPIVPAFAAETEMIDGHATVGPVDYLGDSAIGYAFQRKDDVVLALWDYSDTSRAVSLATGAKSVDIYDWMGNKSTVATPNGRVTVTLTAEPIYIRGVSPAVWGADAARTLELASNSITTMPGGRIAVDATVRATVKPLHGILTAGANRLLGTRALSVPVALKASESKSVPLRLTVPTSAADGTYVIDLGYVADGVENAGRRVRIDVQPPVKIAAITPSSIGSVPGSSQLELQSVKVSLSSTQSAAVTGTLSLSVGGIASPIARAAFQVDPASDPVVNMDCKGVELDPGRIYKAEMTGTTAAGFEFEQPLSISLLSAAHLAKQGSLDAPASHLVALNTTGVPAQSAGSVRVGWSEQGLAISVCVPDTTGPANLQIAVDLDPGKVERSTGDVFNDLLARRRFSVLSFDSDGDSAQAKRIYSYNGDALHCGKLYDWQLPLKIDRSSGDSTYTATIPWKELGASAAPSAGDVIGLGVAANFGPDTRPPAFTLFGGLWPKPDSDALGDVVLAQ